MHAVVVKVTVSEVEKAQEELQNRVVPNVSQAPGFVAGYWTRSGNEGLSMVVFESEDAARQMADRVPQTVPEFVTLENVEVRDVVANA
jgi:heme-degrading monooxygenase HmoA